MSDKIRNKVLATTYTILGLGLAFTYKDFSACVLCLIYAEMILNRKES